MARAAGFAAAQLERVRAEREVELERHRAELARLDEMAALLAPAGSRSRRSLLADPKTSQDLVELLLTRGNALSAGELSALLSRPYSLPMRQVVDRVLRDARKACSGRSNRPYDRLRALVEAVLTSTGWPTSVLVKMLLETGNSDIVSAVEHRAALDPRAALIVGMHIHMRDLRSTSAARRLRQASPWVGVGSAFPVGWLDPEVEAGVRERIAVLQPVDLVVRAAELLAPRTTKGAAAVLERVDALEILVEQFSSTG